MVLWQVACALPAVRDTSRRQNSRSQSQYCSLQLDDRKVRNWASPFLRAEQRSLSWIRRRMCMRLLEKEGDVSIADALARKMGF